MAKTSLKNEEFIRLENSLLSKLTVFQDQHDRAEQNRLRIARGTTLNRISKLIRQVQSLGDPALIMDIERHC